MLDRRWRIIAISAGAIALLAVVFAMRMVVLPFIFGLALLYVSIPVVSWIEARFPGKGRWFGARRVSAIAIVYVVYLLLLGVLSFFVVSAVVDSVHTVLHSSEDYFVTASGTLKQATQPLREIAPPEWRDAMDTYVEQAGETLLDSVHYAVMDGMRSLPSKFGLVLGFATVPFFLFYVLKDREKLGDFYSDLPGWATPHVRSIFAIVADVFGRWIRASLVLGLVVGTMDLIGLLIIRAPLAPLLAVVAGVTEMVPIVGPWMGGAMAVLVTLALAPDKALWVAGIFLSVQVLENVFIVPRIQASFFRIHPAVTIVLLTAGFYFAGPWGLIFALPLAATVIGIYKYCCQNTQHAPLPAEPASSPAVAGSPDEGTLKQPPPRTE